MSNHHIQNHISKSQTRLIMRWPTTINKFQLFSLYQSFNSFFHFFILKFPPHLKVFHFSPRESLSRILWKSRNNTCKYYVNWTHRLGKWAYSPGFVEITIDCILPPDVIVGMWNHMKCYLSVFIRIGVG